jgi:antitoxin (DNA-binding transcriptional repressor) of toxin-antitoxin stability system
MSRVTAKKTKTPPGDRTLDRVERGERVVIRRGRKSVAALIPTEDLKLLERLIEEEEDRIDIESAEEALVEAEKTGTIPWEKVKAELGL